MNLNDGNIHKVLFSRGNLYLDGVQIGGEGITPAKDISFQFKTNVIPEEPVVKNVDNSVLEVCVHDSVVGKAVGPGQM